MAAVGAVTPLPDAAIFADTQAEPASVYRWLDWIEQELPFPVHRVTRGDLAQTALTIRTRRAGVGQWTKSLIPAFTLEPNGTCGHMRRTCTYDYKVTVLLKAQRRLAAVRRGQKSCTVTSWMGISLDEAQRMKDSREPWVQHRYPLIERGLTRDACLAWMRASGYPRPPRSACVFCPFHHDQEWIRLRDEEPDEFARAVAFERELQATKAQTDNMRGVPYLHSSRVPLDRVVFKNGHGKRSWGNECEGMCGI